MPTFKVTDQKLQEYFGEPYREFIDHSKFYKIANNIVLSSVPILLFFNYLKLNMNTFLKMSAILFAVEAFMILYFYLLLKDYTKEVITRKIKELVNDPEILWFNHTPKPTHWLESHYEKKIKWSRSTVGELSPETFKSLSYLKKEGTSQGLYKKIKRWKNSNSATVHLKRLSKKGYIAQDYTYQNWKFKMVNEKGETLDEPEIEKILEKCWDNMLERELEE